MNTICIYHSRDIDGWMSAAIVKHWFLADLSNVDMWESEARMEGIDVDFISKTVRGKSSSLQFLGWDYGDNIPELSEYDKVIMCDVSFPKDEMLTINKRLGENFIWIDHHQRTINDINSYIVEHGIPMEGLVTVEGELQAACELTWRYFFPGETMPEIVRLLGRYDCFGGKGTNEWMKILEFQYGARQAISNYKEAYSYLVAPGKDIVINTIHDNGMAIYGYLCSSAKQTYERAFPIELTWFGINGYRMAGKRKFLCINHERFNPINFGIDYHKDGYDGFACFWYKDGKWTFSLYNDNGEVDCSAIAKQYGGGGHKGASGFVYEGDVKDIIG